MSSVFTKVKGMVDAINDLGRKHERTHVFQDWLNILHLALWVPPTFEMYVKKEEKYMQIQQKYSKEEREVFVNITAQLFTFMSKEIDDYLGAVYNQLRLRDSKRGEVYTPIHIAELLAELQFGNDDTSKQQVIADPTCGSGALLLGYARAMRKRDIPFEKSVFANATDINRTACLMTFVQLSIIGMPAKVTWGNTLTNEEHDAWYTTASYPNGKEISIRYHLKFKEQIHRNTRSKKAI